MRGTCLPEAWTTVSIDSENCSEISLSSTEMTGLTRDRIRSWDPRQTPLVARWTPSSTPSIRKDSPYHDGLPGLAPTNGIHLNRVTHTPTLDLRCCSSIALSTYTCPCRFFHVVFPCCILP